MAKVLIVYSTVGGNTELVVKKVSELLVKNNHQVDQKRVDIANISDIENYNLTILASPTYGQGTVESHFVPFLKSIGKANLDGKLFAVIGLGDNKYYPEYLTESAQILEEVLVKSQAKIVIPALRIGMPPLNFIEKLTPRWVEKLNVELGRF